MMHTTPPHIIFRPALFLALVFCVLAPFTVQAAPHEDPKAWQERLSAQFDAGRARYADADQGPDLHTMIGSMIMVGFRGAELAENDPFLDMLREGYVGHVILFDRDVATKGPRNIVSAEQVRRLTAALKQAAPMRMFVAVDQEGGSVQRLKPETGVAELPAAKTLGRSTPENTAVLTRRLGLDLANLGINVNFAPVVDLDTYPANPVIGKIARSFGADPSLVSRHGLAFGKSMIDAGVIPALKHFPGHGSSRVDSHDSLPDITGYWDSKELQPYVDAIGSGWKGMIMVGHLKHEGLDPVHPASLSGLMINNFLRKVLGWQGVVVTDDLQMKAITANYTLEHAVLLAVLGGADLLVFGNNMGEFDPDLGYKVYDALAGHVNAGRISVDRIRQSWQRINALQSLYPDG